MQSKGRKIQKKGNCLKDPFGKTLEINRQFSRHVQQLAEIAYNTKKVSEKVYLTETLEVLRGINECLKKERRCYQEDSCEGLDYFLRAKGLGNAGNLIGMFEEISTSLFKQKMRSGNARQPSRTTMNKNNPENK